MFRAHVDIQVKKCVYFQDVYINKCCFCLELRTGAMVIAGLNMMLGISILFMIGSDYEDWYVLYTPAALAVICGTILFYGSIFKRRIATLVYLIISSMSTMFYGISAVVLLTLPSAFCCLGVFRLIKSQQRLESHF